MGQYRFVGGAPAAILDSPYSFTSYGQLVEMPDDIAMHAVGGRINIVKASDFDHTPEEVKLYGRFERASLAPPDFHTKRNRLWELAAEYRENPSLIVAVPEVKSTNEV